MSARRDGSPGRARPRDRGSRSGTVRAGPWSQRDPPRHHGRHRRDAGRHRRGGDDVAGGVARAACSSRALREDADPEATVRLGRGDAMMAKSITAARRRDRRGDRDRLDERHGRGSAVDREDRARPPQRVRGFLHAAREDGSRRGDDSRLTPDTAGCDKMPSTDDPGPEEEFVDPSPSRARRRRRRAPPGDRSARWPPLHRGGCAARPFRREPATPSATAALALPPVPQPAPRSARPPARGRDSRLHRDRRTSWKASAIGAILVVNGVLGFWQDAHRRAGGDPGAVRRRSNAKRAVVVRDGLVNGDRCSRGRPRRRPARVERGRTGGGRRPRRNEEQGVEVDESDADRRIAARSHETR